MMGSKMDGVMEGRDYTVYIYRVCVCCWGLSQLQRHCRDESYSSTKCLH